MERPPGLADGEELGALIRVRFSAGMPTNLDTSSESSVRRPTVVQRHAYAHWARRAATAGFPIAGPEMVLGITQERLLVWRPALVRTRLRRFAGAVPLSGIHSASVHRRFVACVLTLLFDQGSLVCVETARGTRLRAFASAIPTYSDFKDR